MLTAPDGVTSLTVPATSLATKRSPAELKARASGVANTSEPGNPVANVLTTPAGVTLSTVWSVAVGDVEVAVRAEGQGVGIVDPGGKRGDGGTAA